MPRLLLICDNFPPDFAPRMGNLCKYLPELDWTVDVIAEQNEHYKQCDIAIDDTKVKVNFVSYYQGKSKLEYLYKYALNIVCAHKDYFFHKHSKSIILHKQYDCVLCSSYHIFPLKFAQLVAREKNIPLYVDLRDIIEQHPSGLKRKIIQTLKGWDIQKRRRNKILKQAQAVISVSPWHVHTLSKINPNTHLIYNGYDDEIFKPQTINEEKFKLTYTGRVLHPQTQDPTLFFEAMRNLRTKIDFTQVEIHWFTDLKSKEIIRNFTEKYQLNDVIYLHDMVSIQQIPNILNQSSGILILTNKPHANGPHGILTTKFFEALGVEKPVLCVPSDEADLANAIQQTNAGAAAQTLEEVEQFILAKYAQWQQNGFTHQAVNQAQKAQFTRQKQAEQFAALLSGKSIEQ